MTNKPFEIVLDLDSVLVDTPKAVVDFYNSRYEDKIDIDTWVTYNPVHNYGEEIGNRIYQLFNEPLIYRREYLYEDVPYVIDQFKSLTDNLSVWTLCLEDSICSAKQDFVTNHIGIPCDTITGVEAKGNREIIGAIIDDYPPNLRGVKSLLKIMPVRPWNKDVTDRDIIKVENLSEALEVIRKHLETSA